MEKNIEGELNAMKMVRMANTRIVYAELAREYCLDWRTVKKYCNGYSGKPKSRNKMSKLDKYKDTIVNKLTLRRITVKGVYEFMVTKYGIKSIGSYSNFIRYVKEKQLKTKAKIVAHPRYEVPMGKQAQVDWKEDITLTSRSGDKVTINIFHVALRFSRYSAVELSIQKRTDDVHRCLIKCLKTFGGVPQELLFDNMSTVVSVNNRRKSLTAGITKLAKDLGVKIRTCKARSPATKGCVEARNKILDWLRVYEKEFDTVNDLIKILEEINEKMNLMINEELGMPPIALFYKEKEYLLPLPKESILDEYLSPNKYIVSTDGLIQYGSSKYSVNPKLIGEEVTIDTLGNKLYIYYKGKLITFHQIGKKPVNYLPEHYKALMKGKVKDDELETTVQENLQIMDKILEMRKVEVSNIEATKSIEALIAYISSSEYGRWPIQCYAHMSKADKDTFIKGVNSVLPYVGNKDAFIMRLKYSMKHDACKELALDCVINDNMAMCDDDTVLTDAGYEILSQRYEAELKEFLTKEGERQEQERLEIAMEKGERSFLDEPL